MGLLNILFRRKPPVRYYHVYKNGDFSNPVCSFTSKRNAFGFARRIKNATIIKSHDVNGSDSYRYGGN